MLVAALVMQTMAAQNSDKQVATLQHGDQTFVFYGLDAFKQAYEAAADTLDVITLSSGEFNGLLDIKKSITVYGAGFENDTITGTPRTYVQYISGITANGVHLEGLYIDSETYFGIQVGYNRAANIYDANTPIYNLEIVKCYVYTLWFAPDTYNCTIRQSHIDNTIGLVRNNPNIRKIMHNFYVANSYIFGVVNNRFGGEYRPADFASFDLSSTIWVDHCVLKYPDISGPWLYTNNIIYNGVNANGTNNIYLGDGEPYKDEMTNNWINVSPEYVWAEEGENGEYAPNKTFAIKTPEHYHATDGTEIGLHGGVYAWNKIPCTPRITECTIDTENVANGMLKLSIKAEAQTKE